MKFFVYKLFVLLIFTTSLNATNSGWWYLYKGSITLSAMKDIGSSPVPDKRLTWEAHLSVEVNGKIYIPIVCDDDYFIANISSGHCSIDCPSLNGSTVQAVDFNIPLGMQTIQPNCGVCTDTMPLNAVMYPKDETNICGEAYEDDLILKYSSSGIAVCDDCVSFLWTKESCNNVGKLFIDAQFNPLPAPDLNKPSCMETCPDGLNPSDGFCVTCGNLVDMDILSTVSEYSCNPSVNVNITVGNAVYTELVYQQCNSTCYGVKLRDSTCDEAFSAFQSSCNQIDNIASFTCYDQENGTSVDVNASCTPKINPCELIFSDFVQNCTTPNIITGVCQVAANGDVNNTLSCDAPELGTLPCDTELNNLKYNCDAPSYIIGDCTDDGTDIISSTRECFTPSADSNLSDTKGLARTTDINNQTKTLNDTLNKNSDSTNKNLNDLLDSSNKTNTNISTTNTKLDKLSGLVG